MAYHEPFVRRDQHRIYVRDYPGSELFLIPGAQHFVQLDEPEQVAGLILTMPGPGSNQA
jgi:pimeloyl-ACP methyl ester carboxylesterase